jgi:hypothetical protein
MNLFITSSVTSFFLQFVRQISFTAVSSRALCCVQFIDGALKATRSSLIHFPDKEE